ncbi:hypothetical protein QFC24_004270 [Naganishia onofrii]|uniref:Uncharacterized protein n=1 Tax=Naganishia onofrii TaxID=1851511 RepID=A0ACC2XEI1_9TREE|nr:hypothetical protein QFC24_004270 [Naganishia onofrii]
MEEQQLNTPNFPLSSADFQPEQALADETRDAVTRLAILAEHSVENIQANDQQHHGREHEVGHQQMDQEHDQQHHMDPELHDPQQQQQHLPPSMAEALDQQNLDEQHLRHAEGLLSFANENVGNEYYASQTDNLSRMLEAQTVDTLGGEAGNDLENGAHDDDGAGVQLDENGYPLDSGLNGALYGNSQDAQHAAMMAGEHGAHMGLDGVDGMHDDYHSGSGGSSSMRMDSSRKRKRISKDTVPAEAVKLKKDVHKEVERKRRAVINEGVAAIAAVLPTNEKQKGLILAHAAQYIRQLQENERINTNSWAEEKGMLEQDIADLRSQLQHTQARLEQEHAHFERIDLAWREAEERAAVLQSELEDMRRRIAEGGASAEIGTDEADEEAGHGHVDMDQEHVDDTLDNPDDEFAIEGASGAGSGVGIDSGSGHDGAVSEMHDEHTPGYAASEPGDHEVLAA